jgi:hypothetical protein
METLNNKDRLFLFLCLPVFLINWKQELDLSGFSGQGSLPDRDGVFGGKKKALQHADLCLCTN